MNYFTFRFNGITEAKISRIFNQSEFLLVYTCRVFFVKTMWSEKRRQELYYLLQFDGIFSDELFLFADSAG